MEIDIDRIELLQRHDHGAGVEVGARVDGDDAGASGERSAQLFLRNVDFLLRHGGALGLEIRGALVVIGLADHLHGELVPGTGEGDVGERRGGLELMQQRDVLAVAQLQQQLTLPDLVTRLHVDAGHETCDIEGKVGAAHRAQRPHRAQLRLPILRSGLRGADHRGRRRLARGDHPHDRQHLDARDHGDQSQHRDDHHDHALGGARLIFDACLHARLSRGAVCEN